MRAYLKGVMAVGLLLTATAIAQPPAGPTAPKAAQKLKSDIQSLLSERDNLDKEVAADTNSAAERMILRTTLLDLIKKLGDKKQPPVAEKLPSPRPVVPPIGPPPIPKGPEIEPATSRDPLREAQNLYQAGHTDAAYRALQFQLQKADTLSAHDRTFAQYLSACCLRRTGKLAEAAALFREVADGKQDVFFTESALTQISLIRSVQDVESKLEELRVKRNPR